MSDQLPPPGVYIAVLPGPPKTIVGVATDIPAFIGYTEKAEVGAKPVRNVPVLVTSMAQFEEYFGGPFRPQTPQARRAFNLYDSMQLFYANGGGTCYVVSGGDYSTGRVDAAELLAGLAAIGNQDGPTMLAIPDLVLLEPPGGDPRVAPPGYGEVMRAMLAQCGRLRDRVAILDVYGAGDVQTQADLDQVINQFHTEVGNESLSYGAAYFPFLQTTVVAPGESNVLPPSGAMAGVYTFTDRSNGVWTAPANVTLTSVTVPTYLLDADQQGPINAPPDGKAVNAIREFAGRGTVVWGGRTLDGNNAEDRYVNTRRTLIYIDQSIEKGLQQFAYSPNRSETWVAVVSMVSAFLQNLWSQGGLLGATPAEAFSVACGLGSTMTSTDILEGNLRLLVTVQMIRPAEFIELSFLQKVEGVA